MIPVLYYKFLRGHTEHIDSVVLSELIAKAQVICCSPIILLRCSWSFYQTFMEKKIFEK